MIRLIETRHRKSIIQQDAALRIGHDYEDHLKEAKLGQDVGCFCVKHPFVVRLVDGGKHGPQKARASVPDTA